MWKTPDGRSWAQGALWHLGGFGISSFDSFIFKVRWNMLGLLFSTIGIINFLWYLHTCFLTSLGAQLRRLMLANNQDFASVEIALKRTSTTKIGRRKEGKWVTKHYLQNTLGWTKTTAQLC